MKAVLQMPGGLKCRADPVQWSNDADLAKERHCCALIQPFVIAGPKGDPDVAIILID